jgi:insulysin
MGERREWKGSEYVSHLIGHEGKKSLYSVLRDEGYVESLSAGGSDRMERVHLFSINLTLTSKGYLHYRQVIVLVFQYLNLLKQRGV